MDDTIYGYGGYDILYGDGGDDWLDGGSGQDEMHGERGDDTYIVDDAGDLVVEESTNEGYVGDTVKSYVSYTLTNYVERLELLNQAVSGTGNSLNNEIVGNSLANTLYGLGGDDTLRGGGGNDTLDGGANDDVMYGGRNDDTYIVRQAGDVVIEYAGEGRDTVFSNLGDYTLTANVEDLVLEYGVINGTGNGLRNQIVGSEDANTINGMGDNDTLYGMGGQNTLNGGTGDDVMYGGAGDDTYKVGSALDTVVEYAGEGLDTVESTVSYALTANVENLTLVGNAADGTGNGIDNKIIGNAQNNTHQRRAGRRRHPAGVRAAARTSFVFDTALGRGNIDILADFNVADDTIVLDNAVFTALTMNAGSRLAQSHVQPSSGSGRGAMDSTDRIIYNWQHRRGALRQRRDRRGGRGPVRQRERGARHHRTTTSS